MSEKFAWWVTVLTFSLSMDINACLSQQLNIFNATVPARKVASGSYSSSHAITLGVKFWSSQSGTISGIRFYRGATSPLGYVARLYSQSPVLNLSFQPPNPSITSTTPSGTMVATIVGAWSDGSPFTGTFSFAQPYSNDGGVFALSGNQLIINPSGPGVGSDAGTVQNVTVVATQ
jgi:hypothetical protein